MRCVFVLLAVAAVLAGCSRELPEEGSPDVALYRARCSGNCHVAHQPRSLTPKMWDATIVRMEAHILRAGQPALSAAERRQILDYLTRHAGGR